MWRNDLSGRVIEERCDDSATVWRHQRPTEPVRKRKPGVSMSSLPHRSVRVTKAERNEQCTQIYSNFRLQFEELARDNEVEVIGLLTDFYYV